MSLYEKNFKVDLDEFIHTGKQKTSNSDDFYQNNLKALGKHHPELVELIESINIDDNKIKILYSKSGDPRVLYKKEDGEEIYIHSDEDPANCANQAIDLLGNMEKEGIAVLFGFGLGYFADEVLRRFEKGHVLMVYEATPPLFKAALETRDLSELLNSEKVNIILGEDADNLSFLSMNHQLIANGKFWVVQHHPSTKLNEKAYERFFKRLKEEKLNVDMNTNTGINMGKEFINAFMANIPTLLRKHGVIKLKDIFKGRPAVIVSAGPSLDRNLHLLKNAKGKAVIIAVDAALPTLLPCNIIPDVVVAIDPLKKVASMYKDNPLLKHVPLICLSQYQTDVILTYPGPVFINSMPQSIIHQWFAGFWDEKGYIECAGGSVAHLAFGAAEFFGVDTIAFVGQDLSFAKRSHSRGFADISDKLEAEAIEKGLTDMHSEMRGTFPTENIFKETVLTRSDFLTFKTAFQNIIKNFKGTVINATEGGLPIDGAIPMRLIDYIYEYCENEQEIDTLSILSDLQDGEVSYNLEGLLTMVTTMRNKFIEIRQASKRILKYIKILQNLKKKGQEDSAELHNILNKIESLIEKVKNPVLDFIASTNYRFELYLQKQEVKEIDEIEDKWERLDQQLERGQNYYNEIIKAINPFNKQLDKLIIALQREERVNSILTDESLEEKERFFNVGMIYKRAGMVAQAVKYLEAVMRDELCVMGDGMRGDKTVPDCRLQVTGNESLVTSYSNTVTHHASRITDVYIFLAELYLKQFRFYEAKKVLEGVRDHGSDKSSQKSHITHHASRITALLKICDKKIKAWDKCKREMGKLLKDAGANYGSHLESGYFYFRIKDYERAEKAYLKAVMRDELCDGSRVTENEAVMGVTDHASRITHHGSSAAYYGLAHTYLAMDASEKAVSTLEKAIDVDPKNPILYRDMGIIAIQDNDFASAEIFLTKAIELAPHAEELYKLLSNLYINQGETEKAISLYEDALLVNADNPVIQQDLAMFYKEMIVKNDSPQSSQRTQS